MRGAKSLLVVNNMNEEIKEVEEIETYVKLPVEVTAVRTAKEELIQTLNGVVKAEAGEYIIKGVKGELYPCKPDIFQETYVTKSDYEKKNIDLEAESKIEWITQLIEEKEHLSGQIEYLADYLLRNFKDDRAWGEGDCSAVHLATRILKRQKRAIKCHSKMRSDESNKHEQRLDDLMNCMKTIAANTTEISTEMKRLD